MTTERDRIQHRTTEEAQRVIKETRIDLDAFLALNGEERAARWRQWPVSAKEDAIRQQLGRAGYDATAEIVAQWISHYDEKYTAGPIERAVEGALERLIDEHSQAIRLAVQSGDKASATAERRQTTAFSNALDQYQKGIRPDVLPSGARRIPSSTPGKPVHIVTMDGDWVCSCQAGASMHWPIALVIGIEVAEDHMRAFDDPPGENPLGDEEGDELPEAGPNPIPHASKAAAWIAGQQQLTQRLAATAQYVEALRAAQGRETPAVPARRSHVRLLRTTKRSAAFVSALALSKAA